MVYPSHFTPPPPPVAKKLWAAYAANPTAISTGSADRILGGGGLGRQHRSGPHKYQHREEGKGGRKGWKKEEEEEGGLGGLIWPPPTGRRILSWIRSPWWGGEGGGEADSRYGRAMCWSQWVDKVGVVCKKREGRRGKNDSIPRLFCDWGRTEREIQRKNIYIYRRNV